MIKQITVVGGTHGNEWLGPVLIDRVESEQTFLGGAIRVSTLLANPRAYQAGVRFIDKDLNRCFTRQILSGSESYYEHQRAREIHKLLGNSDNFIIDLHSTTSNMGLTVIVSSKDKVSLRAAAYVQQHMPEVKLIQSDRDLKVSKTLNSISGLGLSIEVGALPNNVVRHDLLEGTEKIVHLLIEYLEHAVYGPDLSIPDYVYAYRFRDKILFPQDEKGNITGFIHRDIQDRDFQLLRKGDCVFFDRFGNPAAYDGEDGYPIFINEAAYYQERVAFIVTDKVKVSVL